ncbi:MAG: methyltransferase [DPANN group archaeon]|nr:methyltransferase [DPANN group archaeon]
MIFQYKDFSIETDNNVYEPSEDTYLLISALEKIVLKKDFKILEVGCGTGIVSISLSSKVASVVACDINSYAVKLALSNVEKNRCNNVKVIESDLFSNISGKFDLIVFNTPYLPQDADEDVSGEINYAWDGGVDGRKVIDRFLSGVSDFLSEKGCILFLESSLSSYEKSIKSLESVGFQVDVIGRQKLHFEELVVVRAVRGLS